MVERKPHSHAKKDAARTARAWVVTGAQLAPTDGLQLDASPLLHHGGEPRPGVLGTRAGIV
jgi:hypothetical protein